MSDREAESLRLRAEIFKALGHPTRLWIVERLAQGECCVADLAAGVEGGLSAVSQHLALLRQTGLVRDTRHGRQIYYSLTFPCIAEICAMLGGPKVQKVSPLERLRKLLPVLTLLATVSAGFILGQQFGREATDASALAAQPQAINTLSLVTYCTPSATPAPTLRPRMPEEAFRYRFPPSYSGGPEKADTASQP